MSHFLKVILSVLCLTQVKAYYTTIALGQQNPNLCTNVKHYIMNPNVTCCMGMKIYPGLPVEELWDDCATQGDEGETVEQTSWRIYSCFVKKGLSKSGEESDTVSLTGFATLITAMYPEDTKSKIMSALGSFQAEDAPLSEIKPLNQIRLAYYDAERQVCSGFPTITPRAPERGCETWEEENKIAGGLCCTKDKTFLPFDLNYKSYFMMDFLPGEVDCKGKIKSLVSTMKIGEIDSDHLDNLANMCDYSSKLQEMSVLEGPMMTLGGNDMMASDYWLVFTARILPSPLSGSVKQSVIIAVAAAMSDMDVVKNETMAHEWPARRSKDDHMNSQVISNGLPGVGEKIPEKLFPIALNCVAHRRAAAIAEYQLYNMC